MNQLHKSWFAKFVDSSDTTVAASTIFLIICSITAILLLLPAIIAMIVELCYNHTITLDLHGLAEYITASLGIFAAGGITKGWTNYSTYKYKDAKKKSSSNSEESSAVSIEDENYQEQI